MTQERQTLWSFNSLLSEASIFALAKRISLEMKTMLTAFLLVFLALGIFSDAPDIESSHCASTSELISHTGVQIQLVPAIRGDKVILHCKHCELVIVV